MGLIWVSGSPGLDPAGTNTRGGGEWTGGRVERIWEGMLLGQRAAGVGDVCGYM